MLQRLNELIHAHGKYSISVRVFDIIMQTLLMVLSILTWKMIMLRKSYGLASNKDLYLYRIILCECMHRRPSEKMSV